MKQKFDAFLHSLVHWTWTKGLLYWLFVSAGTMSECAFLVAAVWMSINSSVHPMVLALMSEETSVQISYIASTIFTALPEMIIGLALLKVFEHCRNIRRSRQYWYTWVWPVLFGMPTLVFLVISVLTVACSVLKVNYVMPDWGIVARALAGYLFVIVSFLYERIGEPCYASERKGLESKIAELNQEIERLNTRFKIEVSELTDRIKERDTQVNRLAERASSLLSQDLAFYPIIQNEWVEKQKRTASIDEIASATGLSKQKINAAIKSGKLQKDNRNKDLIRVSSVIDWLRSLPSNGHNHGDTDPLGLPVLNVEIA